MQGNPQQMPCSQQQAQVGPQQTQYYNPQQMPYGPQMQYDSRGMVRKPPRTGAQKAILVLGVLFLIASALGVFLVFFLSGLFLSSVGYEGDPGIMTFGYLLEFSMLGLFSGLLVFLGMMMIPLAVPGIAAVLLYVKLTKARVIANAIIVGVMWAFLLYVFVGDVVQGLGSTSGSFDIDQLVSYLELAIAPALYTACIVSCNRDLKARS